MFKWSHFTVLKMQPYLQRIHVEGHKIIIHKKSVFETKEMNKHMLIFSLVRLRMGLVTIR